MRVPFVHFIFIEIKNQKCKTQLSIIELNKNQNEQSVFSFRVFRSKRRKRNSYTISFILIFELSILKQNQKSPEFSQLLWMSKDIILFFLSLVLKTWFYRTQYRDQNINNRNRILISLCDENQISKKSTKTPSRGGECKFACGRRGSLLRSRF